MYLPFFVAASIGMHSVCCLYLPSLGHDRTYDFLAASCGIAAFLTGVHAFQVLDKYNYKLVLAGWLMGSVTNTVLVANFDGAPWMSVLLASPVVVVSFSVLACWFPRSFTLPEIIIICQRRKHICAHCLKIWLVPIFATLSGGLSDISVVSGCSGSCSSSWADLFVQGAILGTLFTVVATSPVLSGISGNKGAVLFSGTLGLAAVSVNQLLAKTVATLALLDLTGSPGSATAHYVCTL